MSEMLPSPPRRKRRLPLVEHLRGYFIAGILFTAPTALTLYLTWLFIDAIDGAVRWLLPDRYNPATYLHVPGLGIVIGLGSFEPANYVWIWFPDPGLPRFACRR